MVFFYELFFVLVALAAVDLSDEDQRWYRDARDGLRHLRLLLGLACAGALAWRLIAG